MIKSEANEKRTSQDESLVLDIFLLRLSCDANVVNMTQEELPMKLRRSAQSQKIKRPVDDHFVKSRQRAREPRRGAPPGRWCQCHTAYPLFYDEPDWVVCPFIITSEDFRVGHPVNAPRVCWQRGWWCRVDHLT